MENLYAWLANQLGLLWSMWEVKVIFYHTLLNVAVAVCATIYSREFLLNKLAQFLYRKLLPFVGLFAVFSAFGEGAGIGGFDVVVFGFIETMLAADLIDNLKRFGLPIPDSLTKMGRTNPLLIWGSHTESSETETMSG